jgi:putative transcriptional regulator
MAHNAQSGFHDLTGDSGGYLAGKFLISSPGMVDGRFKNTVIYMCAHDAEQAMGIIINKPKPDLVLSSMLPHLDVEGDVTNEDTPVLYGGPVESERGFVLHTRDFTDLENSLPLSDTMAMTTSKSVLSALTKPHAPKRAVLALGYAGWHAGQLENELVRNSWLVSAADENMIFEGHPDAKWKNALSMLGIAPELLSAEGGHA